MNISELKAGNKICALERHRKTMCPILDIYTIVSVDTPHMEHLGNTITEVSEFTLEDQDGYRFKVTLEVKQEGSICDRIYYTPNIELVAQEVINTKRQAESILNNRSRYETIVDECKKILNQIYPKEKEADPKETVAPTEADFAAFKKEMHEEFKPYFDKMNELVSALTAKTTMKESKNNKTKENSNED